MYKEVKYNVFADGNCVITQSPHGAYQQYQGKGVAVDFRSEPLISPFDGCKILRRGDIGRTGEWFDLQIAEKAFIRCVHGKPNKRVGSTYKAGEVVGIPLPTQKGLVSHWHLAVWIGDLEGKKGRWRDPLTYMDRRVKLSLGLGFKDQKWKNWSTWDDRTLTIRKELTVFDPITKPIIKPPEIDNCQKELAEKTKLVSELEKKLKTLEGAEKLDLDELARAKEEIKNLEEANNRLATELAEISVRQKNWDLQTFLVGSTKKFVNSGTWNAILAFTALNIIPAVLTHLDLIKDQIPVEYQAYIAIAVAGLTMLQKNIKK